MNPLDAMRPDLRAIEMPPVPDISEIERRTGRPVLKLDANENPYGPSPRVTDALAACDVAHYPDPEWTALRRALGGYLHVDPARIACSAGGDEMLDLLMRLFLEPGDEVIDLTPAFVMYPLVTAFHRGRYVPISRTPNFAVDLAAVERVLTPRTKIIFLCNPNNPTGNATPREEIERVLNLGPMVILDEAYAEFAGWTHVDLVERYPNLIVLRTMSKWAALAGLRLGYLIADPSIPREMSRIKSPFNVNIAAQVAGIASLEDRDYLMANVHRICEERDRLYQNLNALPFGYAYPSETNFLYWATDGVSSVRWRDALQERGVLVRAFRAPVEALRITVGTPEGSGRLLEAMEEVHAASRS